MEGAMGMQKFTWQQLFEYLLLLHPPMIHEALG